MYLKFFTLFLIFTFSVSIRANGKSNALCVKAQMLSSKFDSGRMLYRGQVEWIQGNENLSCEELIIWLNKSNEISHWQASGKPSLIVFKVNNLNLKNASAQFFEFSTSDQTLTLMGQAKIISDKQIFLGEYLKIFFKEKKVFAPQKSGTRHTFRFKQT